MSSTGTPPSLHSFTVGRYRLSAAWTLDSLDASPASQAFFHPATSSGAGQRGKVAGSASDSRYFRAAGEMVSGKEAALAGCSPADAASQVKSALAIKATVVRAAWSCMAVPLWEMD